MGGPKIQNESFTYGDYLKWPDDERWELIDGQAYAMTPAPLVEHQRVLKRLIVILEIFFQGKPCELFHAPLDVRLPHLDESDEAVDTVVQPDLLVLCDPAKVDEKGVRGAPDLTLEILSESTAKRDMGIKLELYERHGVRCYIIVDPWGKTVTCRYLEPAGRFGRPELFLATDQLPIRIFEGLIVDLAQIFNRV